MNRKELIKEVATKMDLPLCTVENVITTTIDIVKKTVKKGDDVTLIGFGTFTKVKRAARMGVNPSTGESMKIKAKNAPKFRPGQDFKNLVNGK